MAIAHRWTSKNFLLLPPDQILSPPGIRGFLAATGGWEQRRFVLVLARIFMWWRERPQKKLD